MLNDYVDKVFVINLLHRKDRLERFNKLSRMCNFTYEVFEAFDGKQITNDFEYEGVRIGKPYVNESYFKGQIGALICHLSIIKYCKEHNGQG